MQKVSFLVFCIRWSWNVILSLPKSHLHPPQQVLPVSVDQTWTSRRNLGPLFLQNWFSSDRVSGHPVWMSLFVSFHSISVELRSGLWLDHSRSRFWTLMSFCSRFTLMFRVFVLLQLLLSFSMQTDPLILSCWITGYTRELNFPLWSPPGPEAAKPQIMMLPPPYKLFVMMFSFRFVVSFLFHTKSLQHTLGLPKTNLTLHNPAGKKVCGLMKLKLNCLQHYVWGNTSMKTSSQTWIQLVFNDTSV